MKPKVFIGNGLIIWCYVLAGKGTGRFGEERSWMKRREATIYDLKTKAGDVIEEE